MMVAKRRSRYWVLRDGKNYFKQWKMDIGPIATQTRGEAARFPSKRKAMQSPAYSFMLASYEPEAVR
jgi:hypothetical protein